MNREQQIEEIAKDLEINDMVEYDYTTSEDIDEQSNIYYDEPTVNINYKSTAKHLIEAGYGNIREFAKEIHKRIDSFYFGIGANNARENAHKRIDELVKQFLGK